MTPRLIAGLAALFAGVSMVSAVVGVGAAWLVHESRQSSSSATTAPSTQPATTSQAGPTTRPTLLETTAGVTLTGQAICGSCFLGIGPTSVHPVVLETDQPYRTFLLAENDKLKEIESITGSCAAGDIQLTATGDVFIVNGQNVLLVQSFAHRDSSADTRN